MEGGCFETDMYILLCVRGNVWKGIALMGFNNVWKGSVLRLVSIYYYT